MNMLQLHVFVCCRCSKRVECEGAELWFIDGAPCPAHWVLITLPVGAAPANTREGGWLTRGRHEPLCRTCWNVIRARGRISGVRGRMVGAIEVEGHEVKNRQSLGAGGDAVPLLPAATKKRPRRRGGSGGRKSEPNGSG